MFLLKLFIPTVFMAITLLYAFCFIEFKTAILLTLAIFIAFTLISVFQKEKTPAKKIHKGLVYGHFILAGVLIFFGPAQMTNEFVFLYCTSNLAYIGYFRPAKKKPLDF